MFSLNKTCTITIDTPVGPTSISVRQIVKHGTVLGPHFCCASTQQVNELETINAVLSPDFQTQGLTFVDNIARVGSISTATSRLYALRKMEQSKKFTFSPKKTNIRINKGSKKEVNYELKEGMIR